MKKFKVLLLVALMSLSSTVFAAGAVTAPGDATAPVVLNAEAATFDVSVPMNLPVSVSAAGEVSTATNLKLVNNSPLGNVVVSDVNVSAKSGWVLEDFSVNFKEKKVNSKEVSFRLNNSSVDKVNGTFDLRSGTWGVIPPNGGELSIDYTAKLPVQGITLSGLEIGQVVFTVDWDYVKETNVKDSDYAWETVWSQTRLRYIGTHEIVDYIPKVLDGTVVTSLAYTFYQRGHITDITAEIPDTVTCMDSAFESCYALVYPPVIPHGVTSMRYAFNNCNSLISAPVIPETMLNMQRAFFSCALVYPPSIPPNVTNLYGTFDGCEFLVEAPTIPFGVTDMEDTFSGCEALTGSILIPSSVTAMANIFSYTVEPITMQYSNTCTAAVNYVAPSNVTKQLIN